MIPSNPRTMKRAQRKRTYPRVWEYRVHREEAASTVERQHERDWEAPSRESNDDTNERELGSKRD